MSRFYFDGSDSGSDDETALPYPKPLARSAFLAPDFSPTEFLSTLRNRHQTLEDLRQDLRTRSQDLNKELLDLVNNNYQDFLGLGDSLKGGEEKVEEVRLGLLSFRREVNSLRQAVATRHIEVSRLIQERKEILKTNRLGRNLLDIDARLSDLEEGLQLTNGVAEHGESLDLDFLSSESDSEEDTAIPLNRLIHRVQQFMQIQRLITKIGSAHPFLMKQESRITKIRQTLVLDLNNAMRTVRSSPGNSQNKVLKLLSLYQDLGEQSEAVKLVKR